MATTTRTLFDSLNAAPRFYRVPCCDGHSTAELMQSVQDAYHKLVGSYSRDLDWRTAASIVDLLRSVLYYPTKQDIAIGAYLAAESYDRIIIQEIVEHFKRGGTVEGCDLLDNEVDRESVRELVG